MKAFDFFRGEWVLAEVLKRHDNNYSGAIVKIFAGDSAIETTLNHPFWVVAGEELDKRCFRASPCRGRRRLLAAGAVGAFA